ncbi:hypothetical protein, partial [Bartonella queenslandensis]|uniref:hypothetical protein n=1 Tax=Bartonella queenslandensis TaxID=481138 RepID=UPI0018DAFC65
MTQKAQDTRKKLLEHFDEEVVARLKSRKEQIKGALDERGRKIRTFCQIMLPQAEHFADKFIHKGQHYYYHWKQAAQEDGQFLKVEHDPIAPLIEQTRENKPLAAELTFHYEHYGMNLADLEQIRGKSGWLRLSKLKFDSLDNAEKLVFSVIADDGSNLDQKQCERLMLIPATCNGNVHIEPFLIEQISQIEQTLTQSCFEEAQRLNERYFNEEHEKLERWAEDSKEALNLKIKQLEKEIKEEKKQARSLKILAEKVTAQRQVKKLEKERDKLTMDYFETRKKVDEKLDEFLDD